MSRTLARVALALALALGARASAQQPQRGAGVVAQPARTASTTTAADSVLEARTRAVASQLRCPICQGISIQESPSELAQDMRDVVREQLRAGRTEDQIKDYFVGRYGEWILLEPRAHGFNFLVYALPLLFLVGGGGVLVVAMRRWVSRPPAPETPSPRPSRV